MHPYVISLILGAIISAMFIGAILLHDATRRRESLVASLLLGCGVLWSLCQILWNSTDDPLVAVRYMRLSSACWMTIAPLAFHLALRAREGGPAGLRRVIPWSYAITAAFVVLDCATPWFHERAVETSWGYTYLLGPGFYAQMVWILCLTCPAVAISLRGLQKSPSAAERSQDATIGLALMVPMGIGLFTDGLLPLLEIPFPHLGAISIGFLGIASAFASWRFGYSVLIPIVFAEEILETLPGGVTMIRLDGRIGSANRTFVELIGESASDLCTRHVNEILTSPLTELVEEPRNLQCELITQDGKNIPVLTNACLLRNKGGIPIGVVVVVLDQREVADLRDRLMLSGRLAAVGELAAGVAHEINNPLAYVRSNLSLLAQHWNEVRSSQQGLSHRRAAPGEVYSDFERQKGSLANLFDEGDELLAESLEGVDRAASIVQDIRGFAHAGSANLETLDVNSLLESVLRIATPQIDPLVQIDSELTELPLIECAPQQLKQVFLNLILNASQAISGEGHIRVTSEETPDRGVLVRVSDDGAGIPDDVMDRVFDPFFTTKPVGEGTGLGLSISYEIVRRHGGEILVESSGGDGTCFEVRLPG